MKQNWSRVITVFIAMLVAVFMASSAMAFTVTNRSAEMDDFSPCDRAGTIKMIFEELDFDLIAGHLATNDYAEIRIALNGTDLPPDCRDIPLLCKDIKGTATAAGVPHSGELIFLNQLDVELSQESALDMIAYVWGQKGDQIIHVYITWVNTFFVYTWEDIDKRPWFKIGLYDALLDVGDTEDTSICADVHCFSGISKLTISNESIPEGLTFTGDNEIGHFVVGEVECRDCDKDELTDCPQTTQIELCPIVAQAFCPNYSECLVLEGNFTPNDQMVLVLRTNGSQDGATTQDGLYLESITLRDQDGNIITSTPWDFLDIDDDSASTADCAFEAVKAMTTIDTNDIIAAGDELQVCITYEVDPDTAVADTDARFWAHAYVQPCGDIANCMEVGAYLVECGGIPTCMYFPYVLTDTSPWMTGLVITNLSSDVVIADMEVTFTLTDSTGAEFTYTKADFDSKVSSFSLDSVLTDWGWAPQPGNAWLYVEANFQVDGYEFLTDGVFGAGTQPRVLLNCGDFGVFK